MTTTGNSDMSNQGARAQAGGGEEGRGRAATVAAAAAEAGLPTPVEEHVVEVRVRRFASVHEAFAFAEGLNRLLGAAGSTAAEVSVHLTTVTERQVKPAVKPAAK